MNMSEWRLAKPPRRAGRRFPTSSPIVDAKLSQHQAMGMDPDAGPEENAKNQEADAEFVRAVAFLCAALGASLTPGGQLAGLELGAAAAQMFDKARELRKEAESLKADRLKQEGKVNTSMPNDELRKENSYPRDRGSDPQRGGRGFKQERNGHDRGDRTDHDARSGSNRGASRSARICDSA